jgi:AcrR family transcriptional regulator
MPRTERGRETLNKILSAAAQVFYQKGYSQSNVNEIAKLAGVATGTFYIYFDGKYGLYKYLLLQCSHQIRKHLAIAVQGCETRREAERVGMKSWLEYLLSNQYVYNLIWESLYVDRKLFEEYYENFARAYMAGIDQAKATGEVRDVDSQVLAYVLIGAANFVGLKWGLFQDGTQDLDFIADEFMKLLEGGMFSQTPTPLPPPPVKEPPKEDALMFRVEVDDDFLDGVMDSE